MANIKLTILASNLSSVYLTYTVNVLRHTVIGIDCAKMDFGGDHSSDVFIGRRQDWESWWHFRSGPKYSE